MEVCSTARCRLTSAFVERPPSQLAAQAYEELAAGTVRFPAGIVQLGARFDDLPRAHRALDVRERLGLGALLRPTPPRWVHLPEYGIAARPVTNGDYLRFLEDPGYEDPERWRRVFEDQPIDEIEHHAPTAEGLRTTWETYSGTRSFLAAFVRSIIFEVERELDLSPRFSEQSTASDEARPVDRPRSSELAWVAALAARPLGAYLPADYRRDLAPEERDRLAALDLELTQGGRGAAWREALEALDACTGRLRDRLLEALRQEGAGRVAPEFERGLVERDYGAPDFQIATLKFLGRLRAALGRAEDGRVPLRALVYPLSWPSDDPRQFVRDRADRLPWAERPVTGVSLYEASAFADWLTRASGGRALVRLPNEAQLERAASWPLPGATSRGNAVVDVRWKLLFPWETRSAEDPAELASGSVLRPFSEIAPPGERALFDLELSELRELVRKTSRTVGEGASERRIEMLLGFQWEWTRDRVGELEPPTVPIERAGPIAAGLVQVTRSVPSAHRGSWFAARGGPPRLAGPQLTTRRFGFYPLRGAPENGFRLVVEARAGA
jgi:formylglycine-generating enzyme required for sulfatase activity